MKDYQVAAETDIQLTPEGRAWLEKEILELRNERVPELLSIVQESANDGDITDNSDWEPSKDELVRAQERLADLEAARANATIAPPIPIGGAIAIGARVTIRAASGEDTVWILVHPLELFVSDDRVSIDSPVGQALIGKHAGDTAIVRTPEGEDTYTIIAVD